MFKSKFLVNLAAISRIRRVVISLAADPGVFSLIPAQSHTHISSYLKLSVCSINHVDTEYMYYCVCFTASVVGLTSESVHRLCLVAYIVYSKMCLRRPLKIDKTKVLMENGSLMKVKSIVESILQYF